MGIYRHNILPYLRDLKRPCPGRKIRCEREVMVPTFKPLFYLLSMEIRFLVCGNSVTRIIPVMVRLASYQNININ